MSAHVEDSIHTQVRITDINIGEELLIIRITEEMYVGKVLDVKETMVLIEPIGMSTHFTGWISDTTLFYRMISHVAFNKQLNRLSDI